MLPLAELVINHIQRLYTLHTAVVVGEHHDLTEASDVRAASRGTESGWPSLAKHVLIRLELLIAGCLSHFYHSWINPSRQIHPASFFALFADIVEIAISVARSSSEQNCAWSLRR